MKKTITIGLWMTLIMMGILFMVNNVNADELLTPTCSYTSSSISDAAIDTDGAFIIQTTSAVNSTLNDTNSPGNSLYVNGNPDPYINGANAYSVAVQDATPTLNTTTWTIDTNEWPDGTYTYYAYLEVTNTSSYNYANLTTVTAECAARTLTISTGKGVSPSIEQLGLVNEPKKSIMPILFIAGVIGLIIWQFSKKKR